MQKLEKNEGITLIALVITIIVLLILAGISMATLTGENGLINRAQDAKVQTEIGREKEIIGLAAMSARMENEHRKLEETGFRKSLNDEAGEGKTDLADIGEEFEVLFKDSGRYYSVGKDGKVEIKDVVIDENPGNIKVGNKGEELKGDENSPYEIWCIEDLVEFSKLINNNEINRSCYVKLMQNLNFKSMSSYKNYKAKYRDDADKNAYIADDTANTTIMELCTQNKGFIPIGTGTNSYFMGDFDGQGKQLENIYIDIEENAGLFINLRGKVQNVIVSGKITSKKGNAGGIAGSIWTTSEIDNCFNKAEITAMKSAGGIASNGSVKITKCGNIGKIVSLGTVRESNDYTTGNAGGIIGGNASGTIIDCYNIGEVIGGISAGGIMGYKYAGKISFINCYNEGKIVGMKMVGGIIGETCSGNIEICNSYNIGEVQGEEVAGGLAGYKYWTTLIEIKNSYNIGKINGNKNVGEIVGVYAGGEGPYESYKLILQNCYYIKNKAIGNKNESDAILYENDYIRTVSFVNELNNNILNFKNSGIDITDWREWQLDAKNYPKLKY